MIILDTDAIGHMQKKDPGGILWRGLILPYEAAAEQIHQSFPARPRQELKDDARIAAIALAYRAAVWTCNDGDYTKLPGLVVFRAETAMHVK